MLRSTPLRPIAERMRELSEHCKKLDIATAFVSRDAVTYAVEPAIDNGAEVRFLTGTFGNVTRAATFRQLTNSAHRQNFTARVWGCGTHCNFHAKMYVWTLVSGEIVAWVGSANLTDGGLQNEGELIAEMEITSRSTSHRELVAAFEYEWSRGRALDEDFLRSYREATRPENLTGVFRRSSPGRRAKATGAKRLFVVLASRHYAEDGTAVDRIGSLLGGTADAWYRGHQRFLSDARIGDSCVYVDVVDHTATLVEVTDVVKDGPRHRVFAYEPLAKSRSLRSVRGALQAAGLTVAGKGFRSEWIDPSRVPAVLRVFGFPARRR